MPVAVDFEVDRGALQRLQDALNRFRRTPLTHLTDDISAEVVSQTQHRISDEKTSPDGVAWAAWSEVHAASRHSGQSLLMGEGELLKSIEASRSGSNVIVGSSLEYAAMMQHGGTKAQFPNLWGDIPARPYLGIAEKNETSLGHILDDWANRAMGLFS